MNLPTLILTLILTLTPHPSHATPAHSPQLDFSDALPGPYEHLYKNDDGDNGSGGHGPGTTYAHTVSVLSAAGINETIVRHRVNHFEERQVDVRAPVQTFWESNPSRPWADPWRGHHVVVDNPVGHFGIAPSLGGCDNGVGSTVGANAVARKCRIATNAGFFNTHTHQCLGNLVGEGGDIVQMPYVQNVNFGTTKDGDIVVGYLNASMIQETEWDSLVAGVVWLVRDGESFVDVSQNAENMATQESGGGFVGLRAARIALGHDANGSIVIVQIEPHPGIDLWDFATLLIDEFGLVNAINLDGGGSVTWVQDGVVRNYVTDACAPNSDIKCQRHVTSITCIHDAPEFATPSPPPPSPPSPPPPRPPPPSPRDVNREVLCKAYQCDTLPSHHLTPSPTDSSSSTLYSFGALAAAVIAFSTLAGAIATLATYLLVTRTSSHASPSHALLDSSSDNLLEMPLMDLS